MDDLELAAMLMEEAGRDQGVAGALYGTMKRYECETLDEFVEKHPTEFRVLATALIGMVDQLPNVRTSYDG